MLFEDYLQYHGYQDKYEECVVNEHNITIVFKDSVDAVVDANEFRRDLIIDAVQQGITLKDIQKIQVMQEGNILGNKIRLDINSKETVLQVTEVIIAVIKNYKAGVADAPQSSSSITASIAQTLLAPSSSNMSSSSASSSSSDTNNSKSAPALAH